MQVSPFRTAIYDAKPYRAMLPTRAVIQFGSKSPSRISTEERQIIFSAVQDTAKNLGFDWSHKPERIKLFLRILGQLGQYPADSFDRAYEQLKESMETVEYQACKFGAVPMVVLSPGSHRPVTGAPQVRVGFYNRHSALIGENGAIAIYPIVDPSAEVLRFIKPSFSRPGADGKTVEELLDPNHQKTSTFDRVA